MCGEECNPLHDYIILGLPFNPVLSTDLLVVGKNSSSTGMTSRLSFRYYQG